MGTQSTYILREQSCVWRLPKYWPPTPLSNQRVCPSPAPKAGGTHSPGGEGRGGSIFWKTPAIGLASCKNLSTHDLVVSAGNCKAQVLRIVIYILNIFGRSKGSMGTSRLATECAELVVHSFTRASSLPLAINFVSIRLKSTDLSQGGPDYRGYIQPIV